MSDIAAVDPTINVLNLFGPRNEPLFLSLGKKLELKNNAKIEI